MDLAELRLRVKGHLERRKLKEKLEDLERALLALVRAVEAKDVYTAGHGKRVAQYAAEELGTKPEELEDLHMGALLHDVGKIGIPDHILRGDYALTEHEWRLIREHPVKGDEIIRPLRAYTRLKPYVRWHHEKLDGSGYPDGLTQIPLLVQAVTAADIYDALTSARTYRKVARPEEVLQALENEVRQGRLDREVVRAFKSALLRNRALRAV